ncbi:MAG TPA: hypothetical protein VE621_11930, partial [Bryobacteraceae bacterium]|nr:hypothetical protein [Bryobacteraceae bacterium]
MSLRARLRIAIFGLALTIVLISSVFALNNLLRDSFGSYDQRAELLADGVNAYIQGRFAVDEAGRVHVTPEQLSLDLLLHKVLERTVQSSPSFHGLVLIDKQVGPLVQAGTISPSAVAWKQLPFWQKVNLVFGPDRDIVFENQLPGGGLRLALQISTASIRAVVAPRVVEWSLISAGALAITTFLGVLVSNFVARSLERLSSDVERLSSEMDREGEETRFESPELADLQEKLRMLADRYRGARRDAAHLRSNIDQ